MKYLITFFIFITTLPILLGQIYVEKQTRHRFAQMNLGIDMYSSLTGNTYFINSDNQVASLDIPAMVLPRFFIGGTHFWGHADFEIAIPLGSPLFIGEGQEISFRPGVQTIFKFYPWRIQSSRVVPYLGTAMSPFYYQQNNNLLEFTNGPENVFNRWPLMAGVTYTNGSHMISAGLTYNYSNSLDYYISPTQMAAVSTPPLAISLSYKYMFDTTISAEKDWESGRTHEVTDILGKKGKLNGFFVGVGMSSVLWTSSSSYNEVNRPYVADYGWSLMPDFSLGYYHHGADISVSTNYRSYSGGSQTYGTTQSSNRKSLGFEAIKFLGDYHGFVPFVGPIVTYENLNFKEANDGTLIHDISESKVAVGITFGWDIRPNKIQSFILRTNLRYFPSLHLDVTGSESISFNNLEFNFIQAIIYPGRF